MLDNFKKKMRSLKRQIKVLYLVYFNENLIWYKKAFILLILIYALSPIDLIPDFIPVLGLLDDFIIVPFMVYIAMKMIPDEIWEECANRAEQGVTVQRKYKTAGLILICLIWVLIIYRIILLFIKKA